MHTEISDRPWRFIGMVRKQKLRLRFARRPEIRFGQRFTGAEIRPAIPSARVNFEHRIAGSPNRPTTAVVIALVRALTKIDRAIGPHRRPIGMMIADTWQAGNNRPHVAAWRDPQDSASLGFSAFGNVKSAVGIDNSSPRTVASTAHYHTV